jgi:endonuclease III
MDLVEKTYKILEKRYRSPRLGNKKNPLNELLFIQLSLRTTGPSYERVYKNFKKKYPRWEDVHKTTHKEVAEALSLAGLSNQKTTNLKAILGKIEADFGRFSLAPLKSYPDYAIEQYLCSLPGIGKKSARCIMLYSFDRKVFPVDAHCFRIIKRLGWIGLQAKHNDRVADEIQEMVDPAFRYSLHVNMVAHGRSICQERYPKCKVCVILEFCEFGKNLN